MTIKKPNLLLVFSDQHRWCDLGSSGNGEVSTPNLDAFAADGVRFDRFYSNCPLCVPARGSLLTGRHAMGHGAVANDLPVREDCQSVATILRQAGYRTGYIGKWHLAGVPRQQAVAAHRRLDFETWKVRQCSHDYLNPGYHDERNEWHVVSGYEPVIQTDLALDFLERNAASPWGLVLSWGPPHDPYDAVPKAWRELYDSDHLSLRPNVPERILHRPGVELSQRVLREWTAGYYAHLSAMDEQFGRIVRHLKQTGEWDQTLIVYTSDHGDMLGSHGLTLKQLPYEESARIPLLAGGGIVGSRPGVCSELLGLVDLAPTLLGALGLSFDSPIDGLDFSRLLQDPGARGRDEVYLYNLVPCHHGAARGDYSWRATVTRQYAYAMDAATRSDWFLFDLANDPFQLNNLVTDESCLRVRRDLKERTEICSARHDALLPWPDLVREFRLLDAWNRSQSAFGLPILGRA